MHNNFYASSGCCQELSPLPSWTGLLLHLKWEAYLIPLTVSTSLRRVRRICGLPKCAQSQLGFFANTVKATYYIIKRNTENPASRALSARKNLQVHRNKTKVLRGFGISCLHLSNQRHAAPTEKTSCKLLRQEVAELKLDSSKLDA